MPNVADEKRAVQRMSPGVALVVILVVGTLVMVVLPAWAALAVATFRVVARWCGVPL